jgi:hypothetical protein
VETAGASCRIVPQHTVPDTLPQAGDCASAPVPSSSCAGFNDGIQKTLGKLCDGGYDFVVRDFPCGACAQ